MNIQMNREPINRRTFLKRAGRFFLGLAAAGTLTGSYSFKFERFWYQITEVRLKVKNLPSAFEGWKIVQFSDVHLGFHYGVKELRKVVTIINRLKPDIIFFTGDLVQIGNKEPEPAIPLLKQLKGLRGGKWAVIGNHDFYTKQQIIHVLETADFNVPQNHNGLIESQGQQLYIAGIEDVMYGNPNIEKATEGIPLESCILLLAHEPNIADESSKYPISAQFSGHSHGGQICIPLYGPIIRQELANKYMGGFYRVGENRMPLYVNRGIGTTEVPVRLFCRPEITVFHLS